jgi:hypothetical protein
MECDVVEYGTSYFPDLCFIDFDGCLNGDNKMTKLPFLLLESGTGILSLSGCPK